MTTRDVAGKIVHAYSHTRHNLADVPTMTLAELWEIASAKPYRVILY